MHGGVAKDGLGKENVEAVKKGCSNLARHISNVQKFGVPVVVAINQFITDTDAELEMVRETAKDLGANAIIASHWANGGAGIEELAHHVVELADSGKADFKPLYPDEMPLIEKVRTIAQKIYGADDIACDGATLKQFDELQKDYGHFPVCMAKTQYSFSTDPNSKGAPTGFKIPIRELRLSAGAEFIVAIAGEIMTMPGLPKVPSANSIFLDEDGLVQGLF
jgi:formate--tetrahydrofolate ligase